LDLHGAAAFDLAVTSGLRVGAVAGSAQDGSRSAADYEARKRSHHNTEATYTAEGLQFVPLVAEACTGGWAPAATSTWKLLVRAVAGRIGESVSVLTERLQQTLILTLCSGRTLERSFEELGTLFLQQFLWNRLSLP
jgi:hypothetical protein